MMRNAFVTTAGFLFLAGCGSAMASGPQPALTARNVPQFSAGGSIVRVVSRLARAIGCSMSEETVSTATAKWQNKGPTVSISVKDKTIGEIMDALVSQDKRYTYTISGQWINLIPASAANDPNYIYNKHIPGEITLSTDSAKETSIQEWTRQNRVHSFLIGGGDMKRKLPVSPQTVTLVNPTLRERTNWRMMLAGKNYWYCGSEPRKDGGIQLWFSYSVIRDPF